MKQSFAILNDKMLDRLLNVNSSAPRIKPVLNPNAQTITLCEPVQDPECLVNDLLQNLEPFKKSDPQFYYVTILMMENGLRVSECFSILWNQITSTGHFYLKASKGSENRMINSGSIRDYMLNCRRLQKNPFSDLNRFHVYRELKKLGIGIQITGSKKKAVTHAFRHMIGKAIKANGNEIEITRKYLGHKNIKSTKYYHE